jgi:hypothetical protein
MYLARQQINDKIHYSIRESYMDDGVIKSRDLVKLGLHPDKYIIYPGGNACYFHEDVYDQLDEKGVTYDEEELETVFWPFLKYETRRVIEGFSHKNTSHKGRESVKAACLRCNSEKFHMFDMRRIHYLRFGQLDQSHIARVPKKIYRPLLDKSRDEIEQMFLQMENVLDEDEKKNYTYVVFDIPDHFSGKLARNFPQALSQNKVDDFFLEEVCRLDADKQFWAGMLRSDVMDGHLIRYVCWFFDQDYAQSNYLNQLVYDWMASRRDFNPPKARPSMALDEALSVLGLTKKELSELTIKSLTRHYRLMARKFHPDTGGGHNRFIKLNQAFEDLLRKVRSKGKTAGYWTRRR